MMRGPGQFGLSSGWRRFVALFAVAAWVFATSVCPETPEAFATAAQPTIHGDRAAHASGHSGRHASCHRAAHASALAQFSKAIRAGGVIGAPTSPATAVAQPMLVPPTGLALAVTRANNERPPPRRIRFAGFWPHAPPLTL